MSEAMSTKVIMCSFCGQSSDAVARIFAAPGVAICDGCIRSLAAEEAIYLPPSKGSTARLVGRWIKRGSEVAVSLHFTEDGFLYSTVGANDKVLRYSVDGSNLSTVELVPMGERSDGMLEIEDDTLTLRTERGDSVFDRDKSDI